MDLTFEQADALAKEWYGINARAEEIINTFAAFGQGERVVLRGKREVYDAEVAHPRHVKVIQFERTWSSATGAWR